MTGAQAFKKTFAVRACDLSRIEDGFFRVRFYASNAMEKSGSDYDIPLAHKMLHLSFCSVHPVVPVVHPGSRLSPLSGILPIVDVVPVAERREALEPSGTQVPRFYMRQSYVEATCAPFVEKG